jgi:hypothetical protein
MSKYFVTVEYRNFLAPKDGRWQNNTGLQTCNGFIDQHPVSWIEKEYKRQREGWEAEKDHTRFETVLFYAPLADDVDTSGLQDLS